MSSAVDVKNQRPPQLFNQKPTDNMLPFLPEIERTLLRYFRSMTLEEAKVFLHWLTFHKMIDREERPTPERDAREKAFRRKFETEGAHE